MPVVEVGVVVMQREDEVATGVWVMVRRRVEVEVEVKVGVHAESCGSVDGDGPSLLGLDWLRRTDTSEEERKC